MQNLNNNTRKIVGQQGEDAVACYVERAGYTLLARNYNIKAGEIDIIARKDEIVAFIEVKTRNNLYFDLSEVVTFSKQKKIIFTARHYIFRNNLQNMVYRFDVALVSPEKSLSTKDTSAPWEVTYIKNAFTDMEISL